MSNFAMLLSAVGLPTARRLLTLYAASQGASTSVATRMRRESPSLALKRERPLRGKRKGRGLGKGKGFTVCGDAPGGAPARVFFYMQNTRDIYRRESFMRTVCSCPKGQVGKPNGGRGESRGWHQRSERLMPNSGGDCLRRSRLKSFLTPPESESAIASDIVYVERAETLRPGPPVTRDSLLVRRTC